MLVQAFRPLRIVLSVSALGVIALSTACNKKEEDKAESSTKESSDESTEDTESKSEQSDTTTTDSNTTDTSNENSDVTSTTPTLSESQPDDVDTSLSPTEAPTEAPSETPLEPNLNLGDACNGLSDLCTDGLVCTFILTDYECVVASGEGELLDECDDVTTCSAGFECIIKTGFVDCPFEACCAQRCDSTLNSDDCPQEYFCASNLGTVNNPNLGVCLQN